MEAGKEIRPRHEITVKLMANQGGPQLYRIERDPGTEFELSTDKRYSELRELCLSCSKMSSVRSPIWPIVEAHLPPKTWVTTKQVIMTEYIYKRSLTVPQCRFASSEQKHFNPCSQKWRMKSTPRTQTEKRILSESGSNSGVKDGGPTQRRQHSRRHKIYLHISNSRILTATALTSTSRWKNNRVCLSNIRLKMTGSLRG